MGFNNPLTGENGSLIYQQIKSPNFNLGAQTGWAILKNGNAYFFNVVATGTITASQFIGTDFVINTAGAFFYSGAPATDNLILAIANAAGTDGHGNAYPVGLTQWDGLGNIINSSSTTGQIWYNTQSNGLVEITPTNGTNRSPALTFQSGTAGVNSANAIINSNVNGVGVNAFDLLGLEGPATLSDTNNSRVNVLLVGSIPPNIGGAQGLFRYTNSGVNDDLASWGAFGFQIFAGNLTAVQPGTNTPPIGETWHTATLSGNFTTNASDQAPRYRFEGIGGGVVRIDGTAFVNVATIGANTTIFVLPVGYRPTQRKRFVGVTNLTGYTLGNMTVGVTTAGLVTTGPSGATGNQVVMDGMTFPVD